MCTAGRSGFTNTALIHLRNAAGDTDASAPGGPPQCCHMPAILRQRRVCQSGTDVACAIHGSVQTSMSPCAVCFSGFFSPASLPDRGASISTHLLRPLGAEAHLALTTQAGSTVTSAVRADILDGLSQLQPIASIEVTPEPSLGWFVRKLEGTPHWVQIVELLNQTRDERAAGLRMHAGRAHGDHQPVFEKPLLVSRSAHCINPKCGERLPWATHRKVDGAQPTQIARAAQLHRATRPPRRARAPRHTLRASGALAARSCVDCPPPSAGRSRARVDPRGSRLPRRRVRPARVHEQVVGPGLLSAIGLPP